MYKSNQGKAAFLEAWPLASVFKQETIAFTDDHGKRDDVRICRRAVIHALTADIDYKLKSAFWQRLGYTVGNEWKEKAVYVVITSDGLPIKYVLQSDADQVLMWLRTVSFLPPGTTQFSAPHLISTHHSSLLALAPVCIGLIFRRR